MYIIHGEKKKTAAVSITYESTALTNWTRVMKVEGVGMGSIFLWYVTMQLT